MKNFSLKHHLLIAMPQLVDPYFHQSVIYLYEHNEFGAMGIVINKPLRITLGDMLEHLKIPSQNSKVQNYPVVFGGPVAPEQGFIIHHTGIFTHTPLASNGEIAISTSRNILQNIADTNELQNMIVSLGYAGWEKGQLEFEISRNDWIIAPCDSQILFNVPFEKCWRTAAASIGVDVNRLSTEVGHA
jgi:putative transcriptional regulator